MASTGARVLVNGILHVLLVTAAALGAGPLTDLLGDLQPLVQESVFLIILKVL
jgi:hypothetical protein